MKKLVTIAVRDFALPVPRIGSIESHSGYGRGTMDGQEIHLRVQEKRKTDPNYEAEVNITSDFERGDYCFRVGGRVDGLFSTTPPRIEEIKSGFNLGELTRKLSRESETHPYCLQLKTYGYLYWLNHQVVPKLSFHLVSTRTFATETLEFALDLGAYEDWLSRRLDELVEEARKSEAHGERRRSLAANFTFPFEKPRPGQIELIDTVDDGMQASTRMLIQAPTGLGKTAGVLYPTLKEALSRGQKVVYVTPKNSQHSVAEDAVQRFRDHGSEVKALTITAKSKICFKNEPLCNPDYCEYAKDHYTKVYENKVRELLSEKTALSFKEFKEIGEQFKVCPFELQLDVAQEVDVVVCDYNYVFAPRASFGRMSDSLLGQEGKPNLVIDEAHNLPARAMDYYSPSLSTYVLEKMRPQIRELPQKFRADAETLLNECLVTVASCRPVKASKTVIIDPPSESFLEQDSHLRAFLSKYLDSDVEIQPKDVVLRMSFYWSEFTSALEFVSTPKRPEFFTTFQPFAGGGGAVKITCCDASQMLKACYDDYDQVVGFSATLKPFDYYAKLSGLDPEALKVAEFQSPFPKARRKLLIIPEISTKYSDRERSYHKVAEAIRRIAAVKPGNYFAFFPSFEFMNRALENFMTPEGFRVMKQERDMKVSEVRTIVDHLRDRIMPTIVFAVQGGVFSEGVDYPGDTVIGAFVIGPPLPIFDLEREQMREYYERNYRSGFDYAYVYPAMAKAVQAAGRVIRSETDRGIIVLMDTRFLTPKYASSMPADWFESSPEELVSGSILRDVSHFWEAVE